MESFTRLVQENCPNGAFSKGLFLVVDSVQLPCTEYVDLNMQNAFYECYMQCAEATNILAMTFRG